MAWDCQAEQLVQQHAQAVDIAAPVDRLTASLLYG
jgi:hypothetical protein